MDDNGLKLSLIKGDSGCGCMGGLWPTACCMFRASRLKYVIPLPHDCRSISTAPTTTRSAARISCQPSWAACSRTPENRWAGKERWWNPRSITPVSMSPIYGFVWTAMPITLLVVVATGNCCSFAAHTVVLMVKQTVASESPLAMSTFLRAGGKLYMASTLSR